MLKCEKNGNIDEIYEERKIEWKIANFSAIVEDKIIESPNFSFENDSWVFNFLPKYTKKPGLAAFGLYSKKPWGYSVLYDIGFKMLDGTIKQIRTGVFKGDKHSAVFLKLGEILEQRLDKASLNDLTITCILKRENNHSDQPDVVNDAKFKKLIKLNTLSENFESLFANKDNCDTTLNVQEKEYKVHRAVLIARSPVFAAMFHHDSTEKQTGIVDISDCDSESFEEFLKFLYCGKLELSSRSAVHLYETSDKYDVLELKTFCLEYLMDNITVENVCEAVIMADKYDEEDLMSASQDFFNKNRDEIVDTSEWESLVKNNYRLSKKLLKEMLSKMKLVE